jgi:Uma2 family endonuclease
MHVQRTGGERKAMANDLATADQDLAARLAEFENLPLLHEDDPEWDMGEANLHSLAEDILRYGIQAALADRPQFKVFANLNLYYQPRFPSVYISPDVMAVTPRDPAREAVTGYTIGRDGPAPVLVTEVLSEKTAEGRDLGEKLWIYAMIGVEEYLLVDPTGEFLPQRLLLRRLLPNRTWQDQQDPDGGVTSRLGFRVIWDSDSRLRVVDARTGKRFARPDEAQAEADARQRAEARVKKLEAELKRLREQQHAKKPPTKRRRKP